MINHSIDNPRQFVLPKERYVRPAITVGLGTLGIATLLANGLQSDPKFDIKNNAQLVAPISVEQSPAIHYVDAILPETIKQDEITGRVVERETQEFADTYNVQLQDGQSGVNHQSAENIENAVRQVTNGSVYPGAKIETHMDPETGFIVSTYVHDKSE